MERVELRPLRDDRWRWSYSDGNGARAWSNDVYEDIAAAEEAARQAYPDLPLVRPEERSEEQGSSDRSKRLFELVVLSLLAALAVVVGWRLAGRSS